MKKFWVKLLCFLVPVKKYRKRLKNLLMDKLGGEAASALHPRAKGNVLVSYMKDSLLLKDVSADVFDSLQDADTLMVCELSRTENEKETEIVHAYEAEISD